MWENVDTHCLRPTYIPALKGRLIVILSLRGQLRDPGLYVRFRCSAKQIGCRRQIQAPNETQTRKGCLMITYESEWSLLDCYYLLISAWYV
jgi:hypothetical protein